MVDAPTDRAFGGPPDILVNNAGVFAVAPISETSPDTFDHLVALNLTIPFRLVRAFLPLMQARRQGHIVTIGSVADHVAFQVTVHTGRPSSACGDSMRCSAASSRELGSERHSFRRRRWRRRSGTRWLRQFACGLSRIGPDAGGGRCRSGRAVRSHAACVRECGRDQGSPGPEQPTMQLALVDLLRCPRPHEETALIATIDQMGPGGIDRGMLACPVCDARYRIDQGGIVFSPRERDRCWAAPAAKAPTPESVLRAAALLGLAEPGGIIVLGGANAGVAAPLHDQIDVACVLYNPPGRVTGWHNVTPVYADVLPLAPAVLRGALLLDTTTGPAAKRVSCARCKAGPVSSLRLGRPCPPWRPRACTR